MNRIKTFFLLFLSLFLFTYCDNKEDDYFAEPNWLEPPLYEVLQKEGQFSSYLACVDRTLYAAQFKDGGFFTVMAPNDEAFAAYLQEHGYASVSDIPDDEVNTIVAYSMLQSYWLSENLGDVFTGVADKVTGSRYTSGAGVKRQTNYYATIYQDPDYDNKWVIDQNEYSAYSLTFPSNYKYLPVFMQTYFSKGDLTANDYNTFFPNTDYVGGQSTPTGAIGNVFNGQIVKPNMKARNGIAHEVSTVNYPLENMDKFLDNSQYQVFRSLLDFKSLSGAYYYKSYVENTAVSEKYKLLKPTAGIDKVYVKSYLAGAVTSISLYFSPAMEWYDGSLSSTQTNGYTLFVPSNEALTNYINSKLLKYYPSLYEVPQEAITTLINTHMADGMIWPSQLKASLVSTGEYVNGVGNAGVSYDNFGVIDKKFTSNGFIYTIDHVIKSKLFETVYTEIFLNPIYSYLDAAYIKYYNNSLRNDLMKSILTSYPNDRYTALLISNSQLQNDGYTYTVVGTTTTFANTQVVGINAEDRLKRLMRMHLFEGWVSGSVDSEVTFKDGISDYGGWGFRTTYYGDVIRYKNNQLQASGNIEENTFVNITKGETFDNGTVYTVDNMLQYSKRTTSANTKEGWENNTLWYYINQTGQENTNVSQFVTCVQYALKATDSDALLGISEDNFYTIIMPNNNAITRAVANKDLPNVDSLKNGLLSAERVELAIQFTKSHFIQGRLFPDDRLDYLYPYNANYPNPAKAEHLYSTMYRVNDEPMKLINQRTYVTIAKSLFNNYYTVSFTPEDFLLDGKVVITGGFGIATTPTAPARIITGTVSKGNNGYRSNRIAGKAIHHEFNNYLKFTTVKNP